MWEKPEPGFTRGDIGFTIEFANGYGLSVLWSPNHMCSLYTPGAPDVRFEASQFTHSFTAECCEITPSGLGKVHAHCSPETVLKLMCKMERKPTVESRLKLVNSILRHRRAVAI